jgi:hypothetical protein
MNPSETNIKYKRKENNINMMFIINALYAGLIAFILFGLYVELNPHMTNIWWRLDSNGNKQLVISNLFRLIFAPLEYLFYWNPLVWDINFFIWWIVIFIFIILFKNLIKIENKYV